MEKPLPSQAGAIPRFQIINNESFLLFVFVLTYLIITLQQADN